MRQFLSRLMAFLSRTFGALVLSLAASFFTHLEGGPARADENPLPLLPGLEEAVEFWKVVFTRYGASEVIFHDTLQPMKIYQVMEVRENNASRRWLDGQRERIRREHGLAAGGKRGRGGRGGGK